MSKNVRPTIILVLLFAALLAGWWMLETFKPGEPAADTPIPEKYLLPTLSSEDIAALEIKLHSGPSVYLFKGPDTWYLGGQGGERLDAAAIDSGLSGLVQLRAQRTIEAANPAEFGLNPYTATLNLTLTNKRTESLLVGDRNPEGLAYYVQLAGDPAVYLVSRYPIDQVLAWVTDAPREPTPTPVAAPTLPPAAATAAPTVATNPTATPTPTPEPTPPPTAQP
ncbi:MAG: DUF4340 domain-containing protein [Chloroflexi bacterium]|nr:DUF4340 domain-containing protein [Chloroflexota bacterium]MBU1747656.1 DUF4340 domain-containing protein [Chloroflexota bacterium]MBU1879394.1 DUF4340 domain-containing protein [Chloroflexota bacterium]